MAINFPPVDIDDGNPTDGMVWTAPSGRQWMYDASVPGWKHLAATGNSNIIYRGGLDLTQDPDTQFNDIASGNEFAVAVGADPVDDALYPGLGGITVNPGAVVRYDGNQWQLISGNPYATETTPGVVELADVTEAIDESNSRVVLTPQRGGELIDEKIPQAATDVVGKTRYATKTETNAGVETEAALTPASIKDLIDQILANQTQFVPTGMISWYPVQDASLVPPGYLVCDGRRIYNEGVYSDLYQLLESTGNPWGSGPDVILIPDLRGRFVRGYHYDTGVDPDSATYGAAVDDSFAAHAHTVTDPGHYHTYPGRAEGPDSQDDYKTLIDYDWKDSTRYRDTRTANTGISIDNAGGSETKPKNISLTPVIKL